jgi:hypothetical protein
MTSVTREQVDAIVCSVFRGVLDSPRYDEDAGIAGHRGLLLLIVDEVMHECQQTGLRVSRKTVKDRVGRVLWAVCSGEMEGLQPRARR